MGKQIECENCDERDNVIEVNLELFTIDFENDVLEARKNVIEKLEEQNEVEKVLKVYVDKFERFVDTNNILWRTIDIYLTTSEKAHCWKDSKFVKNIFQNCYLRKSINGHTREDLKRRKEQEQEMRESVTCFCQFLCERVLDEHLFAFISILVEKHENIVK